MGSDTIVGYLLGEHITKEIRITYKQFLNRTHSQVHSLSHSSWLVNCDINTK